MKAEAESPIRTFAHGDDAAYEEWVGQHGGYVLTQRSSRSGEFMLHDSECLHLGLYERLVYVDDTATPVGQDAPAARGLM